jgi:hypothetical protein
LLRRAGWKNGKRNTLLPSCVDAANHTAVLLAGEDKAEVVRAVF